MARRKVATSVTYLAGKVNGSDCESSVELAMFRLAQDESGCCRHTRSGARLREIARKGGLSTQGDLTS